MVDVSASEKDAFFEEVGKASAAAVWSAWATQSKKWTKSSDGSPYLGRCRALAGDRSWHA